jgi:hypothetical protein
MISGDLIAETKFGKFTRPAIEQPSTIILLEDFPLGRGIPINEVISWTILNGSINDPSLKSNIMISASLNLREYFVKRYDAPAGGLK